MSSLGGRALTKGYSAYFRLQVAFLFKMQSQPDYAQATQHRPWSERTRSSMELCLFLSVTPAPCVQLYQEGDRTPFSKHPITRGTDFYFPLALDPGISVRCPRSESWGVETMWTMSLR